MTYRPVIVGSNHICCLKVTVACKVAKSFLTLFPVTLVKIEVQESTLHQMNHKKVYFLTRFMQNFQKLNMVGCRTLNDRANHYGPHCKRQISNFPVFACNFPFSVWCKTFVIGKNQIFLNFLAIPLFSLL